MLRGLRRRDAKVILNTAWKDEGFLNPFNQLKANLGRCKNGLTKWSREKLPNYKVLIDAMSFELDTLQCAPIIDRDRERILMTELGRLWTMEEIYWKQKSRVSWLRDGDKNTAYFHATTIQRRRFNRIDKLCVGDDNWIEGEEIVHGEFKRFFENLFTAVQFMGKCV